MLLKGLEDSYAFVGDGTLVYRQEIVASLGARAIIPPAPAHQPRASHAAWLAGRALANGEQLRAEELLPIYIRPSDAELGQKNKTNPV
jgi:tRNA threonylcarbamoyladenosine biosynthesis protein TsaB